MSNKYGTARQATHDNIIRLMRFACWITKATDTFGVCNTYCFSMSVIIIIIIIIIIISIYVRN
jgi:hypothetical protein